MNKYDWVEAATRILGVWFVASGALQVLQTISMRSAVPVKLAGAVDVSGAAFFVAIGTSFLGTIMVLLAPGFVTWLKRKDASARAGAPQRPAQPSDSDIAGAETR
jgi:hypothetical protein